MKKQIALILIALGIHSCGGVTTERNPASPPPPEEDTSEEEAPADLNNPAGNTAIILGANFTDPIGTINLLPIDAPRTATKNLQTTHSDAAVKAFGNKLYVVNRLGGDNIQVVDPSNGFEVSQQFSTGGGTNPQQIIVTEETRGYVTLYQPEDNNDESLSVGDLLIVNPSTGDLLGSVDFTPFTTNDGERFARASAMVIVDDQIFVAIQDLPADLSLPPNRPGKIVVIDTASDRIVDSLVLNCRNPVAMNYSGETGLIYLACADYFDTETPYGGIEAVDPATVSSRGLFVDDANLDGAPGDLEVLGTRGFTTVGFFDPDSGAYATKVVSFDLDPEAEQNVTEIYRGQAFIQDIAVDENGLLLVGDRDPEVNGILFVNPETREVMDGPINTGAAPSSITFIDR